MGSSAIVMLSVAERDTHITNATNMMITVQASIELEIDVRLTTSDDFRCFFAGSLVNSCTVGKMDDAAAGGDTLLQEPSSEAYEAFMLQSCRTIVLFKQRAAHRGLGACLVGRPSAVWL